MGRKKNTEHVNANVSERDVSSSFKLIVLAKNDEQKEMLRIISQHDIAFVKGSPGSGKTFLSVAYALQQLMKDKFEKIIFSRPVVEAGGEKLGFLPGDIQDKIDPYMIPIFDAMRQLLPEEVYKKLTIKNGHNPQVQVLPLAYMRGVTFRNAFVICDEMQNATPEQVRMVLTRLGEGSRIVICGDVRQSDIRDRNGLEDSFSLLAGIEGIGFCTLTQAAIVRHPLIEKIEQRYEERRNRTS